MIRDPDFGITGYTDRWSYHPGDTVALYLTAQAAGTASAALHRFRRFEPKDGGFALATEIVEAGGTVFQVAPQHTRIGSCFEAGLSEAVDPGRGFTLAVLALPTAIAECGSGLATLTTRAGALSLDLHANGTLVLSAHEMGAHGPSVAVTLANALPIGHWRTLAISFDPVRQVMQLCVRTPAGVRTSEGHVSGDLFMGTAMLALARGAEPSRPTFNGRLEAPVLWRGVLEPEEAFRRLDAFAAGGREVEPDTVAAWDFSRRMDSDVAVDAGPNGLNGRFVNLPMRAVKGSCWSGAEQSWKHAPRDYASVHFHEDDLLDAQWTQAATMVLPETLESGLYFLEVAGEAGCDVLPIFVTPLQRAKRSKLAWVAPTFTYLAYTNDRCLLHGANPEVLANRLLVLTPGDCELADHPEYGLSLYDTHADGSGVAYASRRRPCLTLRHTQRAWQGGIGSGLWNFGADLLILSWLEREGFEYEIVTDDDLDCEPDALCSYDCVLTGSHPEYHTTASHDAFGTFLQQGGRLLYLGGNGFYWRVSTHPDYPETIELRRAEDGNRSWASEPGEYYHAFDGVYGGLWRRNGRHPQALVGVGYTGQGFFRCHPYRYTMDCRNPRVSFLFEEAPEPGQPLGASGQIGGGAAGIEIDRADTALGTPEHALTIASATDFDDSYVLANEEVLVNRPTVVGHLTPLLRADLVFFETASGGAVLSTGSVAWAGSLGDLPAGNDVARLMGRAVGRFLEPTPFQYPHPRPPIHPPGQRTKERDRDAQDP